MVKMQVIGNLGKDAIINNVNGKTVINFSVAHTKSYTNQQGQKVESTLWIDCAWWLDRTTIAQYLKKGQQVWVDGEPSVEVYTGQDRQARATQRLRVNELQLLGKANQQGQGSGQAPAATAAPAPIGDPADDLPF
jgi:single-strand DNA-binding protein